MAILGNKAKLGIPRVNPNPQPPNSPLRKALKGRLNFGTGGSTPRPTTAAYAAPTAPSDPFQTASTAAPQTSTKTPAGTPTQTAPKPVTSSGSFPVPTYTPTNGQIDPRDATYWANLAKLRFSDEQEYNKLNREQSVADSNYNYALQQAIQARLNQERQLGLSTIRSGLTDSGYHDRTDAEQTRQYTEERTHAEIGKEMEDQARAAAKKALEEGYGIDQAALLAEAAARQAQIQREEAANGPGEPEATAAAAGGGSGGGGGGSKIGISNNKPVGGGKPKIGVGNNQPVTKMAISKRRKAR